MFNKKILVIKQTEDGYSSGSKPACGICRLEKDNAVLTIYLSLIGFSALNFGKYWLYIVGDDKSISKKELGKLPNSCVFSMQSNLNLSKGVSAGLWNIKDDLPLLVAYQKSEDAHLSAKDYSTAVINSVIADKKIREREKEFEIISSPPPAPPLISAPMFAPEQQNADKDFAEKVSAFGIYNDEAVATENYFDLSEEIKQKLISVQEMSNEHLRSEKREDACLIPQKDEESAENPDFIQNEARAEIGKNTPYYLSVKDELDGIFAKFPAETTLEKAFEDSRFAKVYYSDDKFYVVGLIKEEGKEKYICYGVPSAYRETPPKELAGYCSFVPLSIFDLKGDGYFMMFQDAATGKCVHK